MPPAGRTSTCWGLVQAVSGGFGPIPDVRVVAFPAYNATEASNATSSSLNNISSADPDLADTLAHWSGTNHQPLGITGATGQAILLLASTVVTSGDLPSGDFIGSYHFGTVLPGAEPAPPSGGYGDVSPYPLGMSPARPDPLPTAGYPNYRAELSIGTVGIYADDQTVGNGTVAIGQTLRLSVPITNVGTAALVNFTAVFSFLAIPPFPPVQLAPVQLFSQLNAGDTQFVNFSWVVNETIIGLGGNKTDTFAVNATWNGGVAPIGGIVTAQVPLTVVPAYIALSFTSPTGPLTLGTAYLGVGKVLFAGKGVASVNVTFIGPGGRTLVATESFASGPFQLQIQPPTTLQAGGTYTVLVTAFYNGRTVSTTASPVQIAGSPPPPPSFWNTAVLGPITWLYLILIIVAVLAAAIAFLLLTGRLSRGKLVECGECGSLIPASATVCPKCGAEFETDLVRCSRCASTIPATSQVCPECAAQLLGTPEPESEDPERQGYADFVERYRTEAKKELADNYTEGAFWDWWKRQPTYVSFNQWKLQQGASSRAGMTAPVVSATEGADSEPAGAPAPPRRPPTGGAGSLAADRPMPPPSAAPGKPAAPAPAPPPARGASELLAPSTPRPPRPPRRRSRRGPRRGAACARARTAARRSPRTSWCVRSAAPSRASAAPGPNDGEPTILTRRRSRRLRRGDDRFTALGEQKIAWARTHMAVLEKVRARFERERPLERRVISGVLHVEAKTAALALALAAGGAEVHLAASNPLSTDDDVVAALNASGVPTLARKGEGIEEYHTNGIREMLRADPEVIIDDGADLVALAHSARPDRGRIIGSTEETTTGVNRLRALARTGRLRFPAIDVNDADMKHLFDNRYGCGQSVLDGLFVATNLLIAGRTAVVAGYGWSGKGIAAPAARHRRRRHRDRGRPRAGDRGPARGVPGPPDARGRPGRPTSSSPSRVTATSCARSTCASSRTAACSPTPGTSTSRSPRATWKRWPSATAKCARGSRSTASRTVGAPTCSGRGG